MGFDDIDAFQCRRLLNGILPSPCGRRVQRSRFLVASNQVPIHLPCQCFHLSILLVFERQASI